jgi:hypothetical protein
MQQTCQRSDNEKYLDNLLKSIDFLVEGVLNDGKDQSGHKARNVGRYRGCNEKVPTIQALRSAGRVFHRFDTIVERGGRLFRGGRIKPGAPVEIHDQTPPGGPVMQALKVAIGFRFEVTSPIVMENQPNDKLLRVPATDAWRKRLNTNRFMTSVSRT